MLGTEDEPLVTFLRTAPPEAGPVVSTVAAAVEAAADLDVAIKWRRLTYAVAGDFHHWVCAISASKKQVTLSFHFGGLLDDPDGLLRAGTSRFVRMLDFRSVDEVDAERIGGFVGDALSRLEHFKQHRREMQHDR